MFGLPLHPGLVHFPIALAVVGALAEAAYLAVRRPWLKFFGPILLTLALLGGGTAYFSGQAAEDAAEHQGVPEKAIGAHEQSCIIALAAVALAALLSWATRPKGRGLQIAALAAVAGAALMLYTGHLGGRLVFVHGAGRVERQGEPPGEAAAGEESRPGGVPGVRPIRPGEHDGGHDGDSR
jgi:uncharacterized membrane protein